MSSQSIPSLDPDPQTVLSATADWDSCRNFVWGDMEIGDSFWEQLQLFGVLLVRLGGSVGEDGLVEEIERLFGMLVSKG